MKNDAGIYISSPVSFNTKAALYVQPRAAAICGNSLQIAANCYSRKSENHKADFPLFFLKFLSSKL